jgi:hypothetical protein
MQQMQQQASSTPAVVLPVVHMVFALAKFQKYFPLN